MIDPSRGPRPPGVGDSSPVRVEAQTEGGVDPERVAPALVGQLDGVRQGDVGQCVRARVRHGARHVRNAVEHRVMHGVGRVGVGRRPRVLETSALVDGDVDEHGAGVHPGHLLVGHEARGAGSGDEDGTDHHVGVGDGPLDLVGVGRDRLAVALVDEVGVAQLVDVVVEQQHLGLHAQGDRSGVHPGHAGADDDDLGGVHPETPPMRMPRPPSARRRACAPTWGARRPATSDIGASRGRLRSGSSTVS